MHEHANIADLPNRAAIDGRDFNTSAAVALVAATADGCTDCEADALNTIADDIDVIMWLSIAAARADVARVGRAFPPTYWPGPVAEFRRILIDKHRDTSDAVDHLRSAGGGVRRLVAGYAASCIIAAASTPGCHAYPW